MLKNDQIFLAYKGELRQDFGRTAMNIVMQYEYMHVHRYNDVSVFLFTQFILAVHFLDMYL
jgi:hypothetical protein